MNAPQLREVYVTDIQYSLVMDYRSAVRATESALKWIESEVERVRSALVHKHATSGAGSIASQALLLAEAQARMDHILQMVRMSYGIDRLVDFWDLVEGNARPGMEPEAP